MGGNRAEKRILMMFFKLLDWAGKGKICLAFGIMRSTPHQVNFRDGLNI